VGDGRMFCAVPCTAATLLHPPNRMRRSRRPRGFTHASGPMLARCLHPNVHRIGSPRSAHAKLPSGTDSRLLRLWFPVSTPRLTALPDVGAGRVGGARFRGRHAHHVSPRVTSWDRMTASVFAAVHVVTRGALGRRGVRGERAGPEGYRSAGSGASARAIAAPGGESGR
jgi:hypothetical protein